MERSVDDPTMRIVFFHQNSPSVHLSSRVINDLNPNCLDPDVHYRTAALCEQEGFDGMFMADLWGPFGPESTRVGRWDPSVQVTLVAPILFAATRHIGVVTTIHTSWYNPVAIARMGMHLDALGKGRWGYNVVTGAGSAEDLLSSFDRSDHDDRYAMAEESLAILKQLWPAGECDFSGKFYQVKGKLTGPFGVQRPYPAIFSAGASPAGVRFSGRNADWMFVPGRMSREDALRRIGQIKAEAEAAGRPANSVRIMRHVSMLVRETAEEAQRVSDWITEAVDLPAAREYVETIGKGLGTTYAEVYKDYPNDDDVVRIIGVSSGAVRIHGSPVQVAEKIKELYDTQECRGVALTFPLWHQEEILRFSRLVMPILEEMGLWVSPKKRGWTW